MFFHKKTSPIVIQVDGIIGVGKTTFINEFLVPLFQDKGLKVQVIREPVDEWTELLPLFYAKPKRYSYLFQTMAFHDRVKISKKIYDENKDRIDVFITERGMMSDPLFMKTLYDFGNVSDIEMKSYKKWWEMWTELVPFTPTLYIYLTADINNIMSRIKKRSRDGESGVTIEYQNVLLKHHNILFLEELKGECCCINITKDYREQTEKDKKLEMEKSIFFDINNIFDAQQALIKI